MSSIDMEKLCIGKAKNRKGIARKRSATARRSVVLLGDGYANHGYGVAPSVNAMAQFSFEWTGTEKQWN